MKTNREAAGGGPAMSGPIRETIRNWNHTVRCDLTVPSVTPGDDPTDAKSGPTRSELVSALQRIVQDEQTYPTPMRAVGSLHSLNECFTTTATGTIARMNKFDYIREPEGDTITVGAGVTMLKLRDTLKGHGRQIEVVPEIGNATAGSVACCGTKDASLGPLRLGQISSTVSGVGMVEANGKIVYVTDSDRLREIRSSYGLLGIVFEVTFKTIPAQKLTYEYAPFHVDIDEIPSIATVLDGASGFLGFLLPYRRRLVAERRRLHSSPSDVTITPIDWGKRKLRDKAWEHIGPVATIRARDTWFPALDQTLETFLTSLKSYEAWAGASMMDFTPNPEPTFDFAFWAFPAKGWEETLSDYLKFCDDFQHANMGFRSALPTEVYFIHQDDSALLSFCPDGDIFTLDLVDVVPRSTAVEATWKQMNERFNEFAAGHGARPLLNQTKFLSQPHMRMLLQNWPASISKRWVEFAALRRKKDPKGRFLTPYFEQLLELGLPPGAQRVEV